MSGFDISKFPIAGGIFGGFGPNVGDVSGQNAIKDATKAQQDALKKAFDVIQQYTQKAIDQQAPYTQNAGPDFQRLRGLVQSGYFQTPYGQSFKPQQFQQTGFTMNPSQGMASFRSPSYQVNSFTPQGLPPMPNLPAYQPPPPTPAPQPAPGPQLSMKPAPPTFQQQVNQTQPNGPLPPQGGIVGPPVFNPQTGQNSPIGQFKPTDPRATNLQQLIALLTRNPVGGSGPYGMNRGGLL